MIPRVMLPSKGSPALSSMVKLICYYELALMVAYPLFAHAVYVGMGIRGVVEAMSQSPTIRCISGVLAGVNGRRIRCSELVIGCSIVDLAGLRY